LEDILSHSSVFTIPEVCFGLSNNGGNDC